jgi:hypothetical protein
MPDWHRQLLVERVEEANRAPETRIPLDDVKRSNL